MRLGNPPRDLVADQWIVVVDRVRDRLELIGRQFRTARLAPVENHQGQRSRQITADLGANLFRQQSWDPRSELRSARRKARCQIFDHEAAPWPRKSHRSGGHRPSK